MSYPVAAIVVFLTAAVAAPALALGVAVLLAGRPRWLQRKRREPGIEAFLMLVVLCIAAVAVALAGPFAAAVGVLPHRFTGAVGLFLGVLIAAGVGYAWRRGVLRWE